MKFWVAAVITIGSAMAHVGAPKATADVVIYLHHAGDSGASTAFAEAQAQHILSEAGVAIEWRSGPSNYTGTAMVIEAVFQNESEAGFKPGALAYATLGVDSGTRIVVLYDRIKAAPAALRTTLLAHVLVHEITHVLEGVDRHSGIGVMKAHWDAEDYRLMSVAPLPFAADDLTLLHSWLHRRHEDGRGYS